MLPVGGAASIAAAVHSGPATTDASPATVTRAPAAAVQRAVAAPPLITTARPGDPSPASSPGSPGPATIHRTVEATPAPPSAAPGSGSSTTDALNHFDELLEMLEERIFAEIERRGGRYSGVF